MNPPGAWAVAVARCTRHSSTAVDLPIRRRDQRAASIRPIFGFLGDLEFLLPTAPRRKSLLAYLSTRLPRSKRLVAGSHGVDIPPFEKLRDFKTWEEEKPAGRHAL